MTGKVCMGLRWAYKQPLEINKLTLLSFKDDD